MRHFPVIIAALLMTICGCVSEKDASEVVVLIRPSSYTAYGGDNVNFDIDTWTIHDYLTDLEISSFDLENGYTDLETRELAQKHYVGEFFYNVPEISSDSLSVKVIFEAEDNLGYSRRIEYPLKVYRKDNSEDALLPEAATSVSMFNPSSDKADGFCIRTLQTVVTAAAAESDIDIYLYQEQESDVLPSEWRSRTGLKFARMSGVNYSTITRGQLRTLYESAEKSDLVQNVEEGNVILLGRETEAEDGQESVSEAVGIILVTGVYDEAGPSNDKYMFNIKKI